MKLRKRLLITLGIFQVLTGVHVDTAYPRSTSTAMNQEVVLTNRFMEVSSKLGENPEVTEKGRREEGFRKDLAVMRRQVDNVNKVNDRAFYTLCISGLVTIAVGLSIKTKEGENQPELDNA